MRIAFDLSAPTDWLDSLRTIALPHPPAVLVILVSILVFTSALLSILLLPSSFKASFRVGSAHFLPSSLEQREPG